ncbi:MAG: EAL domain-containing protein [Candidatus Polarisedimenticolaceae bacterium]|nr:EAL domain-containing protein [Candidatus Polarisedimenticolaceae bacterium]
MTNVVNLRVGPYASVLLFLWTMMMWGMVLWSFNQESQVTLNLASTQAHIHYEKDMTLLTWVANRGRVYVPINEDFQPNPLLSHVDDRDIATPSGVKLTLVNPLQMIRHVERGGRFNENSISRVISLTPNHTGYLPDEWEKRALTTLSQGIEEVMEVIDIDGASSLRMIHPIVMRKVCLSCHEDYRGKEGKMVGASSIILPMRMLHEREAATHLNILSVFGMLWLLGSIAIVFGYLVLKRQIKERMNAVAAKINSEVREGAIVRSALDCVMTIDAEGLIVEFNPAAEKTFGYKRKNIIGCDMAELVIPSEDREAHRNGMARYLTTGEPRRLGKRTEIMAMRADGSHFPAELAITEIDVGGERLFTAYLRDITEAHYLAEQLSFQASHDSLTGLVNRREFEKRLETILKMSSDDTEHCLFFMDLDQFKFVNDSSGHPAGDELLRQLAGLLHTKVRASDVLARLGGDEFGILLEGCPLDKAKALADELLESIRLFRFIWQDKTFTIGASIGIVPIKGTGTSMFEALRAADAACYRAKDDGRNRKHVYTPDDKALTKQRGELRWVTRIHQAFEEGRFHLYRQELKPLNEALTDGKSHFEILIRMVGDNGELLSTVDMITAAERYNLMPNIDRWVVRTTLKWLHDQGDRQNEISLVAINLSGQSITDSIFLSYVKEQFSKFKVPFDMICFEITETTAISNLAKAGFFIEALRKEGCRFALDDFGSGMSSFGYLKNLPVDFLKIDGEFVRDIVNDEVDRAMVKSINEIGQLMGKYTVAEYVESEEILALLKSIGVDYVQGYAIDKPHPLKDS